MAEKITAEKFLKATGRDPVHDDIERCNCEKAGELFHLACGWCEPCDKPRFMCAVREHWARALKE